MLAIDFSSLIISFEDGFGSSMSEFLLTGGGSDFPI